jgi:hypothetical protein
MNRALALTLALAPAPAATPQAFSCALTAMPDLHNSTTCFPAQF